MKKQSKKLTLNKKTISNLNSSEMSRIRGGSLSYCGHSSYCGGGNTKNGNTCAGHNTCYNC